MNHPVLEQESEMYRRVRDPRLYSKIMNPEDTVQLFRDGMYLGFSGFAEGHPKTVPAFWPITWKATDWSAKCASASLPAPP